MPAEAIIGMIDTTMLGVAHRSTVKQTIAEFKDTVPNDARWRLRAWAKHACARRHAARDAPTITTPASAPRFGWLAGAFTLGSPP